jgi:hypothetical protein
VNSSSSVLVRSAISSMPSTAGGFSSVYDIVPAREAAVDVRVPDEENEERNIKLKGCEAEMENSSHLSLCL